MEKTSSGKLPALANIHNFFLHKNYGFGKVKILFFRLFFETFWLLSRTTLPNLMFCVQSNKRLGESLLHKRLRPILLTLEFFVLCM